MFSCRVYIFLFTYVSITNCRSITKRETNKIILVDDSLLRGDSEEWSSEDYDDQNLGDPLLLTPYIEQNALSTAQELARVKGGPFPDDITSYSGFFTVDKQYNSNLFFWFFKSEESYETAPVILWLQGGPGASSMFGLFTEIGPFNVSSRDRTLITREYRWTKKFSILFIDNPVGAGFSFTDDDAGYATNQTQVGENLYSAIQQFFLLFPELQSHDLYLAGESYAGKYIPSLAYQIHTRRNESPIHINLKCLFIGNGFIDPENTIDYSDLVFKLGLVDSVQRDEMKVYESVAKEDIRNGDYSKAFQNWEATIIHFLISSEYSNLWNYLNSERPPTFELFSSFLKRSEVRKAIHVSNTTFVALGVTVKKKLQDDIMVSVRPWVEELLNNGYRMVYYSGQLDIITAYSLSVKMFEAMKFNAADEYKTAKRKPWYVDEELAGYTKTAGNFTEVLVRNSGHMVPTDQPKWAFDLISRIASNRLQ